MADNAAISDDRAGLVAVCLRVEQDIVRDAEVIAEDLKTQEPAYGAMTSADLAAAVRLNIQGLVESVRLNDIQSLSGPRETGRRRAEQGIPLPTVLAGYRLGVKHVWEQLVSECARFDRQREAGAAEASSALLTSASILWMAYDIHAQEVSAEYRTFETEKLRLDHMRRQTLVAALFSGDSGPAVSVTDIAQQLGISSTGPYLVLAAEALSLADLSHRPGLPLGAPHVIQTGTHTDLVLLSLSSADQTKAVVKRAAALGVGRIGVSRLFATLDGVPAAVAQARMARTAGPNGPDVVTHFDRAQIGGLLLSSPEVARGLCQWVLAPLANQSGGDQDLLMETLGAWFEAAGSVERAAVTLHCHPNTVRYRLGKVTTGLGRSLKDPVDLVHLYLAMEARRFQPAEQRA